MEEKELQFDREKHVCYSSTVKAIILDRLHRHYDDETALAMWEKVQEKYVEYLSDLPYLGGKKCRHNGAGGTYDCIAIFAYWEVQEVKPPLDELYEMNNEAFIGPFKRLGKIANINNKVLQRLMNKVFVVTAKADKKLEATCPTGYVMKVEPYDKKKGIRYRFERCPIAEFAKAHNLTHLMPAFCNGDYPALGCLKAHLIRKYTCSNGDYCDYQIVGNESELAKTHPVLTSPDGYMYNEQVGEDEVQ